MNFSVFHNIWTSRHVSCLFCLAWNCSGLQFTENFGDICGKFKYFVENEVFHVSWLKSNIFRIQIISISEKGIYSQCRLLPYLSHICFSPFVTQIMESPIQKLISKVNAKNHHDQIHHLKIWNTLNSTTNSRKLQPSQIVGLFNYAFQFHKEPSVWDLSVLPCSHPYVRVCMRAYVCAFCVTVKILFPI